MHDLLSRAALAYFRDWIKQRRTEGPVWPREEVSGIYRYNARRYVVLRGSQGQVLAVYRIRPSNGCLRRLFNYPLALRREPGGQEGRFYYKIEGDSAPTSASNRRVEQPGVRVELDC